MTRLKMYDLAHKKLTIYNNKSYLTCRKNYWEVMKTFINYSTKL